MKLRSITLTFISIFLLNAMALAAQIDDAQIEPESTDDIGFRHRLDFSGIYFDTDGDSVTTGLVSYAYNLTPKSNLAMEVSYGNSNLKDESSGIGDTRLTYSYSPNVNLSVKPWVPKKIGSGISVILPTGSARNGRSLDAVILNPFIGAVVNLTDSIFLTPLIGYSYSVDPIVTGKNVRLITGEVGIVWAGSGLFWAGFYPTFVKDTEADKSHLNLSLSMGAVFTSSWSMSFTYSDLEHFEPGVVPEPKLSFDDSVQLSVHYLF